MISKEKERAATLVLELCWSTILHLYITALSHLGIFRSGPPSSGSVLTLSSSSREYTCLSKLVLFMVEGYVEKVINVSLNMKVNLLVANCHLRPREGPKPL